MLTHDCAVQEARGSNPLGCAIISTTKKIYEDKNESDCIICYDNKKYINMIKRIKLDKFYSKRPSSIFKKMFKLPSIWLGYSDSAALKMIKSSSKSKK